MRRWLLLCLLGLALPAPAGAAERWTVRSPGGSVDARVTLRAGQLELAARAGGRLVLSAELGAAAQAGRARRDRVRDAFSTPSGKRREHRLDARRLTLPLRGGRPLELLVADDGIALRGRRHVRWRAPGGSVAWLQRWRPNYEAEYERGDLGGRGDRAYPALLRTPRGDHALLTEAGLRAGDAAGRLALRDGGLVADRQPRPWRVAVLGSAAAIVASDLPLVLGRPTPLTDTSWIRPGRAAWTWWADSWSPRRLPDQERAVDAAAAAGWEYVLVDEGWDAAWMPALTAYAAQRGVRILLWTDWKDIASPAARARALDAWAGWGVAGVKVDFLQSDSPARMRFMTATARDAARRRLVVSFHGSTLPRGFQRTWPNALTFEAVRGAEYAKGGREQLSAAHDVDLVFTRNAVGAMDYTPAALSAPGQPTTVAHRLAQAIAYESGLQHYADTPAGYAAHPAAQLLLSAVPAAWDDTRLLGGAPGEHATIARRSGADWFIGALSATPPRTERVPLGFLAAGAVYRARVVTDDGLGGLTSADHTVTAGDALTVPVAAQGGFTVQLQSLR